MSDITVINDSEQSSLVTNGLAKNGELYLKAAGSTDAGAIVVYDSGSWRTFANEASADFSNTYSLSFDGVDDYLDISSASSTVSGKADFSISFWYYATVHPGRLIGAGTSSSNRINISQPNSTFYFGVPGGPTATSPSLNAWHHIVCVKSGTTGNIYIDGNLEGTASTLVATTSSTQGDDFSVGRLPFLNDHGNAKIDEVAVFSTALSASDVASLRDTSGSNPVPADISSLNPVGWWRMGDNDGGTGDTITDQGVTYDPAANGGAGGYVASGNDGALMNSPTFHDLSTGPDSIYVA